MENGVWAIKNKFWINSEKSVVFTNNFTRNWEVPLQTFWENFWDILKSFWRSYRETLYNFEKNIRFFFERNITEIIRKIQINSKKILKKKKVEKYRSCEILRNFYEILGIRKISK